jgi:hypothetical protein
LQTPDEVPSGAGHFGHLVGGFLDAVLAEHGQPGGDRVAKPAGNDCLRDGHQRDLGRVAADPGACRRDPLEDRRTRCRQRVDARLVGRIRSCRRLAGAGHLLRRRKLGISRSSAS